MINTGISKDEIRAYCNGTHAMSARASAAAPVDEAEVEFLHSWLNPETRAAEDLSAFKDAWAKFNGTAA